jgi:hypothetical protein
MLGLHVDSSVPMRPPYLNLLVEIDGASLINNDTGFCCRETTVPLPARRTILPQFGGFGRPAQRRPLTHPTGQQSNAGLW